VEVATLTPEGVIAFLDLENEEKGESRLKGREGPIQLLLRAVEIAAAMLDAVGELIRRAGLELVSLLME